MLSRPGEEKSEWDRALTTIMGTWGPLSEDPLGFTGNPACLLESLQWAGRRTLLVSGPHQIGRILELLELVKDGSSLDGPVSICEGLVVLVTPLWRGASWWKRVEKLRTSIIDLGRLHSPLLRRWEERNGHPSAWTASLIHTKMPYGHQELKKHTER